MPPGASLGVKARAANQLRIGLRRRKWVAPTKDFDFFFNFKIVIFQIWKKFIIRDVIPQFKIILNVKSQINSELQPATTLYRNKVSKIYYASVVLQ